MAVRAIPNSPVLAAETPGYAVYYLQVLNPVNVQISNNPDTFNTNVGGFTQGLSLSQGDGILRLPWRGPLWLLGAGGTSYVNIEVV